MNHDSGMISRRAALAGLAAGALITPAAAQAVRLRAVSVDASPLAQGGAVSYARAVSLYLGSSLRIVFADRVDPSAKGAPTLVARVNTLTLSSFAGGSGRLGRTGADGGNDYLDGTGLLVGPGGAAAGTYPVLAVLDAASAGPWNAPNIDSLRMEALCNQFAWWLRRRMGA